MVDNKSWEEFKESGMLWWINMILHTFGWAIAYEFNDDEELTKVYPVRVKFRGFDEEINSNGYQKVSKFLLNNINDLHNESQE